ncbi:MAG: BMP family ABC transporter substrate-binding protein [Acidobacteria bacterium]|nr:BMP family ABC transporter substrate-binding protein [Acidobacteriota bacterium]
MTRHIKNISWSLSIALLAVAGGLLLQGCRGAEEAPAPEAEAAGGAVKAAFIYVSPVGDAGWTLAHDNARQVIDALPYVETAYTEAVPEGAEAERTINQYVRDGYNLIFTTSFGYMDPTINVASSSPDVTFMHCSGFKTADNVGTYFGRMYQPRYLTGIIAGKMSESNVIGYVAAHPIPEVIRGINAFALGVQSVNPEAKVHVVWTQTWYDPAKEREAAESLLDIGADIIAQHQDTPAPQQAAEKRGHYSFGYNSDMSSFAPAAHLTAPIWNWDVVYEAVVEQVHNGTWASSQYWGGLAEGVVGLAPYSELVPQDVRDLVEAKKAEIVAGTWDVFTGPINNQDGESWVADGEVMADGDMLGMTVLVEGVVGTTPG